MRTKSIGPLSLQTLICTGKQDRLPDDLVTFSFSTLPICLTPLFHSFYVLISPCQNLKTSFWLLPSSTGCIPLSIRLLLPPPSSSVCHLITWLLQAFFLHVHSISQPAQKGLIDSTPLLSNAVCCTLLVWHGYCSQQWFMFFVVFPRNAIKRY